MTTMPTDDIQWATDVGALITEPATATKEAGWQLTTPKQKPKLDYFNWWMNAVYRYLTWLKTLITTYSNVTILDGQSNTALGLTVDPTLYRGVKVTIFLYVDATTDVYAAIEFFAVSNGATWNAAGFGQIVPMSNVPIPGLTLDITTAGVVRYTTISYAGFTSAKASYKVTQLDLA